MIPIHHLSDDDLLAVGNDMSRDLDYHAGGCDYTNRSAEERRAAGKRLHQAVIIDRELRRRGLRTAAIAPSSLEGWRGARGASGMTTLTIDGTTQLPCPICGTAEHLLEGEWWMDRGDVTAVECGHCLTSAPVGTWNQLPRRDAAGGVA